MLAAGLRALQRAAALQAAPASAAGSGLAGSLPGLAAALQRLTLQQPSWAAAQAGEQRHFAAAASGGSGDGQAGSSEAAGAADEPQGGIQLRSESGQLTFAGADQALEAWGRAMDEGAPGWRVCVAVHVAGLHVGPGCRCRGGWPEQHG